MRLQNILGVLLCLVISTVEAQQINKKALDGFEAEVDSLMQIYHTVGLSVAIVKDSKLWYADGFGYRNLANKIEADEQTVYGIGSCTKAFTAALFGVLEADEKLTLTDAPSKYIPSLRFHTEAMNNTIQLKDVLSHSTGLPNVSTESSAVFFTSEDKNEVIGRLQYLPPQAAVGETFIYNNYMYAVAGRITEQITGATWQENLNRLLFSPLQMYASYGNAITASKDPNFSLGYGVLDNKPEQVLPEVFPLRDAGGDIYSSVTDMANWVQLWLQEGSFVNEQILPKKYIQQATGKQQLMHTDSVTGISNYYGYGWMNTRQGGRLKIEHSGGVSGYTSNVVLFPEDKLGIVVLSNQNTAGISFAVTNALITRLLGIDIKPHPSEPYFSTMVTIEDPKTDTVVSKLAPPSHRLEEFVGNYFHPGFGTIKVTFEDNTLYAEVPFTKFRLSHNNNNVFVDRFTERKSQVVSNFLRFTFESGESKTIDRVTLNIDTSPVAFLKQ